MKLLLLYQLNHSFNTAVESNRLAKLFMYAVHISSFFNNLFPFILTFRILLNCLLCSPDGAYIVIFGFDTISFIEPPLSLASAIHNSHPIEAERVNTTRKLILFYVKFAFGSFLLIVYQFSLFATTLQTNPSHPLSLFTFGWTIHRRQKKTYWIAWTGNICCIFLIQIICSSTIFVFHFANNPCRCIELKSKSNISSRKGNQISTIRENKPKNSRMKNRREAKKKKIKVERNAKTNKKKHIYMNDISSVLSSLIKKLIHLWLNTKNLFKRPYMLYLYGDVLSLVSFTRKEMKKRNEERKWERKATHQKVE